MQKVTASSVSVEITDPNTGIEAFVVEAKQTNAKSAPMVKQTFKGAEAKSPLILTSLKGNTQYTVQVKACATADGTTCGSLSEGVTAKTKIGSEFKATILSS